MPHSQTSAIYAPLSLHICECPQTLAYICAMGTLWHIPSQTTPHPSYHSSRGQVSRARFYRSYPTLGHGADTSKCSHPSLQDVSCRHGLNHLLFSFSFAKHSWSLLWVHPLLYSHCHTPTCRLNHFLPPSFSHLFLFNSHPRSNPSCSLSSSHPHTLFPGFPQAGQQPPPQFMDWEKSNLLPGAISRIASCPSLSTTEEGPRVRGMP